MCSLLLGELIVERGGDFTKGILKRGERTEEVPNLKKE